MFLELDKKVPSTLAMIDEMNGSVTYGQVCEFILEFKQVIDKRCLIFILCENSIGAVSGFLSCIENKIVPLLLANTTNKDQLDDYINKYKPQYLWVPDSDVNAYTYQSVHSKYGYTLLKTGNEAYALYDDLSLLLPTSGSTGSPKLVRHNYQNINFNAMSVAKSFELTDHEVAMISLPIHFTQGLSTVNSNLFMGGTILLTKYSLLSKEFWNMIKEYKATSFTGVPYSYDILQKLKFTQMELPDLRIINEGGGRLTDEMFMRLANYAVDNGKKFIATYGSTETTSRMGYLKSELALRKCGSIGNAIVGGRLTIVQDDDSVIAVPNVVGEIVYQGENVTLGYGECIADLSKGDERNGIYKTGDMAYHDEDDCIFIVGRKSRFLKLFGYRISLDETERMLKVQYHCEVACVGTDKKMIIYTTSNTPLQEIRSFVASKTGINIIAYEIRYIDHLPKNDVGKTQYSALDIT